MLNDEVFKRPNWRTFYVECVMRAAQEETISSASVGRGKTAKKLHTGQLIYGRKQFAETLNLPLSTVRNIVNALSARGVIILEVDSHYSVITIPQFREKHMLESYAGQAKDSKKPVIISPKESVRIEKDFNEKFWLIYPKNQRGVKPGKSAALTQWKLLKPDPAKVVEIVEGTKKYAEHWEAEKKSGKEIYVLDPERFLKRKRWLDEYHKPDYKGKHDSFDGKGGSSFLKKSGKVGSQEWKKNKGETNEQPS